MRANSRIWQFVIWSSRSAWRIQASFEWRWDLCAFALDFGRFAERMFDIGGRDGGDGEGTSSSCLFLGYPMLGLGYFDDICFVADWLLILGHLRSNRLLLLSQVHSGYVALSCCRLSRNLWET
jgi:hypothetical protein